VTIIDHASAAPLNGQAVKPGLWRPCHTLAMEICKPLRVLRRLCYRTLVNRIGERLRRLGAALNQMTLTRTTMSRLDGSLRPCFTALLPP